MLATLTSSGLYAPPLEVCMVSREKTRRLWTKRTQCPKTMMIKAKPNTGQPQHEFKSSICTYVHKACKQRSMEAGQSTTPHIDMLHSSQRIDNMPYVNMRAAAAIFHRAAVMECTYKWYKNNPCVRRAIALADSYPTQLNTDTLRQCS